MGKTTVNILAASLFHFLGKEKVAVIDCDYPQHSLEGLREKELAQLQANPTKATDFQALGIQAYPIVGCQVLEALDVAKEMEGQFDLVFIDTPGTINVPGLVELWQQLDYVFMPLEADVLSVEATLPFAAALEAFAKGQPGSRLKQYYAFWNKHVKSEKQEFYRRTEELFAQQNIPFLTTRLEQSVNYKKEGMRSTMFPLSKEFMHLGISGLIQEMAQIIFAAEAPAKATLAPRQARPVNF
ncbi:conjugal transfer protein TraA [Hymenobacter qilianensis]|uniref:Conjugal transfer protein TraA n=2 Tax=Hymenobacter qilianensis TaxID=1385715 RepID=A0ACB5PXA4_9BACT|nr:ParA family protein [Hymenobacter qilianensis]GGF80605.1 conjugal transfer protein TraA [Hymenobacter qilianensis]